MLLCLTSSLPFCTLWFSNKSCIFHNLTRFQESVSRDFKQNVLENSINKYSGSVNLPRSWTSRVKITPGRQEGLQKKTVITHSNYYIRNRTGGLLREIIGLNNMLPKIYFYFTPASLWSLSNFGMQSISATRFLVLHLSRLRYVPTK